MVTVDVCDKDAELLRWRKIERAATALAWADLTHLGRVNCNWHEDFSERERAEYRRKATAALQAVDVI